jgi:hypothetical protein
VPNEGGIGPRSRREPDGVDQEALARSGLAREHVQARRELEAKSFDQREVGNREL